MWALGLSFLLFVFAAAVLGFFGFYVPGQRQAAIGEWANDLDLHAGIRREALERYFADGLANAATLAAYPTALQALAMRPAGAGRPAGNEGVPAAHLEELFESFVRTQRALGVVLWDAEGKPCVKSRGFVLEAACTAAAREVLASGAPRTGLHLHPAFGPMLTFSSPVRSASGDIRGVMDVVMDPREWLYPLLAHPLAGTSTGEAFLVGRDGADILFLSPLRNRPDAPLSFRIPFATAKLPARRALEGSEIVMSGVDYRGVRVLAKGMRIRPSPWALVVKIDEKEALADFRSGVRRTALVWGSLAFALLGIAWGAWQMRGRRQATALVESEARYKTLLENLPQGIFMKSKAFRYVSVNENYARDLGIRPEEAVGKTDYDLFHKEHADKYREDDTRVMETAQTEDFEERYVQGSSEKWIHTIKAPVRDVDGEIIGVLGVFWDITERKRADDALREGEARLRALAEELESRVEKRTAELEEANREMEAFSYSVSHDLRGPLRAVDGFSRILLEDHAERLDAEGRRLLGVVRTGAQQMGRLIDDLLSFSRVGRQGMARTEVDMEALATAVFRELAVAGEEVSFTAGPLPPAQADASLIRQVFMNLISNALKFTRPKARRTVEVGGRTDPDRGVYWVKDNGVGFDMAYANKLFGVFQRLHSSAEFEGTGVGLALVKRIVNRHGGEVWAEGKMGEGATFSFSLPRPGGP